MLVEALPVASFVTAPVPSRTPPALPGCRPLPVIIGPVFPVSPPRCTPLVVSGVPDGVVIEGPVAPPVWGEALGLEPAARAAALHASKSAWVGWTADARAATTNELTMTVSVNSVFIGCLRGRAASRPVPASRPTRRPAPTGSHPADVTGIVCPPKRPARARGPYR